MLIKQYTWAFAIIVFTGLTLSLLMIKNKLDYQKELVEDLRKELIVVSENNRQLGLSLVETQRQVEQAREEQATFEKTAASVRASINKNKRELENLKGREELVLKKLSLVELRINKSFSKNQNELACITGDATLCTQD